MSVNIRNPITGDLTNASGGVINPKSINEMIAPIEDGTASKAYAVGEQFIMNDLLCEATQAIAQGDTMVIGTNCEESEQLSKQVKDINTSLTANGNRFEAGYSSENDEYGFNIGSTFYPIGASSGGGGGVLELLDFDNAVTLTTTNITTSKDGVIVVSGYLGTGVGALYINDTLYGRIGSTAGTDTFVLNGIPKGTLLKIGATDGTFLAHFVPYKYESISPEVTVYNEAEVTLDYANPLFTFGSNKLSYTATKTCWLVGDYHTTAGSLSINGVTYGILSSTDYTCSVMLKLSRGDTVTLSQTPSVESLHVLEGTISGSVGALDPKPDYNNVIATPSRASGIYTCTKKCFVRCGGLAENQGLSWFKVNGNFVAKGYVSTNYNTDINIELELQRGDILTWSNIGEQSFYVTVFDYL